MRQTRRMWFMLLGVMLTILCILYFFGNGSQVRWSIQIIQTQNTHLPRMIRIDPPDNLLERYEELADAVQKLRETIWLQRDSQKPWQNISTYIYKIDPDYPLYFEKLSNLSNVRTIFLTFSKTVSMSYSNHTADTKNLLIQQYHDWAANPEYCRAVLNIDKPSKKRDQWNPYCNVDKSSILPAKSIRLDALNASAVVDMAIHETVLPDSTPAYVTYLSIFEDALVTKAGSVISKNYKILTQPCIDKEKIVVPKEYLITPIYNEVLSFAQLWNYNPFHFAIQGLQRIIPYLSFLKKNPQIKIHYGTFTKFAFSYIELLGIENKRLCNGTVRAKVAYIPEGSRCWFNHVQNTQLLSYTFRQIIKEMAPHQKRRSLLFIKRTRTRFLVNSTVFENMMQNMSNQIGLNFEIFRDDQPLSLEETMRLFDRAVIVIGPHGAGFVNIIFCRPSTFIIEIMCPSKIVLSIMRLAYTLGHKYYGHLSTNKRINDQNKGKFCKNGVILSTDAFEEVLNYFIPIAAKEASNRTDFNNSSLP